MNKYGLALLMFCVWVLTAVTLPLLPGDQVEARPGGGSSFRSSSSSRSSSSRSSSGFRFSSGSSSRSSGELSFTSIITLVALLIAFHIVKSRIKAARKTIRSRPTQNHRVRSAQSLDQQLRDFKQRDPYFSAILLLDFVHSLYHRLQRVQGHPDVIQLKPFLAPKLQQEAAHARPGQPQITEIVIGQLTIERLEDHPKSDTILVLLEANYTAVHGDDDKRVRHIVRERWRLQRNKGVHSAQPDKMRSLSCPQCGAPAQFSDAGVCTYCNTLIRAGSMQWMLHTRAILQSETQGEPDLISYAVEQGTEWPTIFHPRLAAEQQAFMDAHGGGDWQEFWNNFSEKIIQNCFQDLYRAWSQQQWQQARHLLSDRLYETNRFWVEQYREQGLVNKLESIAIRRLEAVKIERDYFYEAITVRIFASCYDYVVDASDKVVGGSNRKRREFSEYWTFVRRSGVEKSEAEFDDSTCPSCSAPLDKMNMSAECGYCGAKVNTGEFGWVLFLITQDEVYRG